MRAGRDPKTSPAGDDEAVSDPRATIMTNQIELLESQQAHQLDLIASHRPEAVGSVVPASRRLRAITITAKIRCDDRVTLRQRRRDVVPHRVRLTPSMQQKHRRA